MIKLLVNFKKI